METSVYHFHLQPINGAFFPQISAALEKRTELLSRSECPNIWKLTDSLNSSHQEKAPNKKRHQILGVVFLLLGILIVVPGILSPKEMMMPLIVGILSILNGVFHLLRTREPSPSAFDHAAEQLLELRSQLKPGCTLSFSPVGMIIKGSEADESGLIVYDRFESFLEAQDIYLCIYDEKVIVLQKSELAENDESFRSFLSEKVRWISLES